ncbi:MAG TPA: thiamine-phosphate kinase [Polyangiaceae bacterium]|nr:thiamine-phosphate kinase [Polyangiaceae bacterium]
MKRASKRRATGGEFSLIAELARELSKTKSRAVVLGIGDDAAVLQAGAERIVVTVDDQVESVHFDLRWLSLEDVGYRALQAAASDLAAMGASPLGAVASLQIPPDFPQQKLKLLARGQAQAARALGCPLVGGNVTRGARLSVSTTVLGRVKTPITRAGARVGDELWVLGELGWARAGLRLHQTRPRVPARLARISARAKAAWARPFALLAEGQRLQGRAHAAIDVSDGLSGDVQHLAEASGVKAVISAADLQRLVSPGLAELGDLLGEPATALALRGGEDYALLCAGPRARRPARAKVVGRIERGRGSELELENGQRFELGPGFDHLRRG